MCFGYWDLNAGWFALLGGIMGISVLALLAALLVAVLHCRPIR